MKEFRRNEITWTIPEVIQALTEAYEYFDNKSDVIDGDYGVPAPNEEMKLASRTRDALDYLEFLLDQLKGIAK